MTWTNYEAAPRRKPGEPWRKPRGVLWTALDEHGTPTGTIQAPGLFGRAPAPLLCRSARTVVLASTTRETRKPPLHTVNALDLTMLDAQGALVGEPVSLFESDSELNIKEYQLAPLETGFAAAWIDEHRAGIVVTRIEI